jgi:hypothetical protein
MTLFAAGDDGLVRLSTDGAATWQDRSTGLPGGITIVGLFQDRTATGRLRVVTEASGAFATSDGGLLWTAVAGVPTSSDVVAADWDPAGDRLFLATKDDGVWATGEGWINDGLPTRDLTSIDWMPGEAELVVGTDHSSLWGRSLPAVGAPISVAAGEVRFGLRVFPNPAGVDAASRFAFRVPDGTAPTELAIYGVDGRFVERVFAGRSGSGWRTVVWDGRAASGAPVPAGVYFARLKSGDETITRRLVRLGR